MDVSDPFPDMVCRECFKILGVVYQFVKTCQKSNATLYHWCQTTATAPLAEESTLSKEPVERTIAETHDRITVVSIDPHKQSKNKLSCAICHKKYVNKRTLRAHVVKTHLSLEKDMSVVCCYCGKVIRSKRNLDVHVKTMHMTTMVACPVCRKQFKEPFLKRHMTIHLGGKQFLCNVCGKVLKSARTLELHEQQHSGNLNFRCPQCNKGFALKQKFDNHMQTHCENSPRCHVCEVCNQSFRGVHSLKRHQLTHLGIRPFQCHECRKPFYTKSEMKRHVQRHFDAPKHNCPYCEKQFWELTRLREHIMIHKKIKLHRCEICGQAFADSKKLKKHLASRHQVRVEKTERTYCNPETYIPLDKLLEL